jgi:hypothetical protein
MLHEVIYHVVSCLHRASIVSKTHIILAVAQYYKSVEMLKQFKSYKAPYRRAQEETISVVLAKHRTAP